MLSRIRQAGESADTLVEEMLADALGDFGASGKFWNQLSNRMDANLFQRMIRTFAQALDRLMAALQDQNDLGSKLYFKDLEKVQAELVRFADRTRLRKTARRVSEPAANASAGGVNASAMSRQDRAREPRAEGNDPVVQAWMDLTDADEAFALPASSAKDFSRVMADVLRDRPAEIAEESPDFRGVTRKWRIERPAVLEDDQGAYEVGTETVVRQNRDREVWIDISNNYEGTGGSDIYAAVANYAFNNGLVFIEDPLGLTRASIYRRAENMLSSALKFGTARHLRPGEVMLRELTLPDGSTVKLQWGRDDEQNIRQLIELTAQNVTASVPELAEIRYNFDSGQFVREEGNVVTDEDFDRLAASSDARAAKAGRRTLQRAVLGASLLRESDGRGLVQFRAALRAAGGVRPPPGIAYSRQELNPAKRQTEPGQAPGFLSEAAGPSLSRRPNDFTDPETRRTISTTRPTERPKGREPNNSYTQNWVIERADVEATDKHVAAIDKALREYDTLSGEGTPEQLRDELIEVVKGNLLWLHDQVPANIRERAKLWYDGANRIANEWAAKYDVDARQTAGVLAALSPQMDWFKNVSLAERVIDIHEKRAQEVWSPAMTAWFRSWVNAARTVAEKASRQEHFAKAALLEGRTLDSLNPVEAAYFIRTFDETHLERRYRMVTPEGGFGPYVTKGEVDLETESLEEGATTSEGDFASITWGGFGTIAKGVAVLRASPGANLVAVIDSEMGGEHKVRNFYNNIIDPGNAEGHVTIDTHAVGAGLMKVVSGSTTEVKQNLGGGGGQNAVTGASGTYGLFADAYRAAAAERGLLAREMQSITWEAIRALFPAGAKKGLRPTVDEINGRVKAGAITREKARELIAAVGRPTDKMAWSGMGEGNFAADGATSLDLEIGADGERSARTLNPQDAKDTMSVGLSVAQGRDGGKLPGLRNLTRAAERGDLGAQRLLQDVAVGSLGSLLSGTSARLKANNVAGLYGGAYEPSAAISIRFTDTDRPAVLAALAQFADNFGQEQIHVRQGLPSKTKPGLAFPDGSYATPVYRWTLTCSLTRKEVDKVIKKSGLSGLTFGEDFVEAYFVGDPSNAEAISEFESAAGRADDALGSSARALDGQVSRLWPYGDNEGAIRYDDIRGQLPPEGPFDPQVAQRVAAYAAAPAAERARGSTPGVIRGVDPIRDITPEHRAVEERRAREFSALPDNDLKNPRTKRAYRALGKALLEQFDVMPIKVEISTKPKLDADGEPVFYGDSPAFAEPYANSDAMRRDVQQNNHLFGLPTDAANFGPEGTDFSGHPLLEPSGRKDVNGRELLMNDVLRLVHDYFAHNMSASQFGPKGEDAAWKNHMASTLDPWARWALTVETKMQNAWQNFSPGAANLAVKDRPFSRQKASLPPLRSVLTGDRRVDKPVLDLIKKFESENNESALRGSLPKNWDGQYVPDPGNDPFATEEDTPQARFSRQPKTLGTQRRQVDFTGSPLGEETLSQRMERKWVDRMNRVKGAQEYLKQKGFDIRDSENVHESEQVYYGKTKTRFDRMNDTYVRPILDRMKAAGLTLEEVDEYLYARHAQERNREIAKRNPQFPDGGSGTSNREARKILAQHAGTPKGAVLGSVGITIDFSRVSNASGNRPRHFARLRAGQVAGVRRAARSAPGRQFGVRRREPAAPWRAACGHRASV